jgi:hypothetical protein
MRRPIEAMIWPLALLAFGSTFPAIGGDGIKVTVGVTPSCPYGLAG